MILSEFIKKRRTEQGLSLRDVARNGGISLGGVHDLEIGRTNDPHVSNLLALARGLRVKPEILLSATKESLEKANGPSTASA